MGNAKKVFRKTNPHETGKGVDSLGRLPRRSFSEARQSSRWVSFGGQGAKSLAFYASGDQKPKAEKVKVFAWLGVVGYYD